MCLIGGDGWGWGLTTEGGEASTSIASSSHTLSSSSSELLRMMTLPSLCDLRRLWFRSPKSFLVNSSSHEESGKRSSSSKDRSTTEILFDGPPCSNTSECRWRDETSGRDPSVGGDTDGDNDGVEMLLGEEEPSLEGAREQFVPSCLPLLSSEGWLSTQDRRSIYNP
jgi:hypothetical protein